MKTQGFRPSLFAYPFVLSSTIAVSTLGAQQVFPPRKKKRTSYSDLTHKTS